MSAIPSIVLNDRRRRETFTPSPTHISKQTAISKPPPDLYRHDKKKCDKTDCRLCSKTCFSSDFLSPLQLEVVDNETCDSSGKVHPCRCFSRLVGKDIKTVSCDGNSCSKLELMERADWDEQRQSRKLPTQKLRQSREEGLARRNPRKRVLRS